MGKEPSKVAVNSQTLPGGLYIVATPIGNLADITLRALDVLKRAEVIACEDTRVTEKLLSHYGISTRTISYHEHNADKMRPRIMEWLAEGKAVALVSDAGTPLISDPGYKLVHEARASAVDVYPIPGASSVMAALCASGLPTDRFLFAGFLPAKTTARHKMLNELAVIDASIVLFESARRLPESLTEMAVMMPEREVVIARELTKLFEEFRRGTAQELAQYYSSAGAPKGEVVIVIAPPVINQASYNEDTEAMLKEALQTSSVKQAAADIAQKTGLPRNELYSHALRLKGLR